MLSLTSKCDVKIVELITIGICEYLANFRPTGNKSYLKCDVYSIKFKAFAIC
jgi:hypothetical protein